MDRSRDLDVLVRREREKRQRCEGHDIVPPDLMAAVESTRAEIERVLSGPKARLKLKDSRDA